MVSRVEHFERVAGYADQVLVEHISLQNARVLLVLLIVRAGHISDDVEELRQVLQTRMELRVAHQRSLFLVRLLNNFLPQLMVQVVETLQLQRMTNVINSNFEWYMDS